MSARREKRLRRLERRVEALEHNANGEINYCRRRAFESELRPSEIIDADCSKAQEPEHKGIWKRFFDIFRKDRLT